MTQPKATPIDLAQAGRMVDAALEAAQINAGERARLGCAKTLLRLEPPPGDTVRPENFTAALQSIGEDSGHG
jgi:hypothetical protein